MALPTKLLVAVGGVAALAAAAWFGWQQFADSGPAPAPSVTPAPKAKRLTGAPKPAAPGPGAAAPATQGGLATSATAAPANPDQLIDEVLTATGLGTQLDQLPEQVAAAVRDGAAAQPQAARTLSKDLERIVAESFTKEGFQRRVRDGLKASYDEKHLRALLSAESTPAAKKMTQLELAKPSQAALAAYVESLAKKPIPPQRQALLQRLDDASNSTAVGTEIAMASMRAMALGAAGSNPNAASEIDKAMERQRTTVSANVRKSSLMSTAFTYRDATDAELSEYIKIYESDHGKWFTGIVSSAIIAEFKTASGQVGEKLAALIKSKQPPVASAKTPTAPHVAAAEGPRSSGGPSDTARPAVAAHQAGRYPSGDLRSCLELHTTVEIIKCAEQGR